MLIRNEEFIVVARKALTLRKVYIELTNRCNLSCPHCFRRFWSEREGDMDRETFDKIIADLREFPSLEEVVFGGIGEPTIAPIFEYALKKVREEYPHVKIKILTNGSTLDGHMLQLFMETDVSEIVVSVENPNPREFEAFRGFPLEKLSSALVRLHDLRDKNKGRGPLSSVAVTLFKDTAKDLEKLFKLAKGIFVSRIYISNWIPTTPNPEDWEKTAYGMEELSFKISRLALESNMAVRSPFFTLKTERVCPFVRDRAVLITWDGNVAPCMRFSHSYPEVVMGRAKRVSAIYFGNIRDSSLKEVWLRDSFLRFRWAVKYAVFPSCLDCDLAEGCKFAEDTLEDCWGNSPSCGDCLWARGYALCP